MHRASHHKLSSGVRQDGYFDHPLEKIPWRHWKGEQKAFTWLGINGLRLRRYVNDPTEAHCMACCQRGAMPALSATDLPCGLVTRTLRQMSYLPCGLVTRAVQQMPHPSKPCNSGNGDSVGLSFSNQSHRHANVHHLEHTCREATSAPPGAFPHMKKTSSALFLVRRNS